MAVKVRIPTPLQKLTNGQAEVEGAGATLKELIEGLEKNYPGMRERICDESGKVRRFVNIFVNDEDVRFKDGDATALKDGDEVSIIPAIAGGAACLPAGGERRREMPKQLVKLTFPTRLIKEPVTYRMALKFKLVPNIRRAKVTTAVGELVLELTGTKDNLDRGVAYLTKKGVKVEPVIGNVIE